MVTTRRLWFSLLAGPLAFVSGLVVPDSTVQKPLTTIGAHSVPQKEYQPWDTPPADRSSDNLIFFRLATLLQHWPNTRYPSGHSVVPGTIPIGTILYHGRVGIDVPGNADWLAFDPEHSALFTHGTDGRLFTFVTTRPLRILYFDGSSAAKLSSGPMDTQDLLAWGKVTSNNTREERRRIMGLCAWGKDLGIDGYVRMEMSFSAYQLPGDDNEIMCCNFTAGLEVVSSLLILPIETEISPKRHPSPVSSSSGPLDPNMTSPPRLPPVPSPVSSPLPTQTGSPRPSPRLPEPRLPNWKGYLPTDDARFFEVFQAGAWHRRAPGEVRVRIDAARLVSLYDPALGSGAATRKGLEKVLHRGKSLSGDDVATWRGWIKDVVQEGSPTPSGVDWQALTTVITDRYGARLEYLRFLLQSERVSQNGTAALQDVREQLMLMLLTDLAPDTIPSNGTRTTSSLPAQYSQTRRRETQNQAWAEPIWAHCSSFLVSHLPRETFTREERTLYAAVSGTQAEICRVLTLLWTEAYDPSPVVQPSELLEDWRGAVDGLMGWLDWTMWNRCTPECSLDTMCFIPTWPVIDRIGNEEDGLSKVDWTPKCIPRRKREFGGP